jgi:predicted O-methyltransferase YrrM
MDNRILEKIVCDAERVPGWMSKEELTWLAEHAAASTHIIEIGSWKGRSTKALACATSGRVYAVDHWMGQSTPNAHGKISSPDTELLVKGSEAIFREFYLNLKDEIAASKVVTVRASSADAVQLLRPMLPNGKADMVFIDADHAYECVKTDIKGYLSLLSAGSLLCGHDYGNPDWPGVEKAVQELLPGHSRGPGMLWHIRV